MNSAFTVAVPRIQTQRLVLREYRHDDFDLFAAHCMTHFPPADRSAAWRVFTSHAGLWLMHGAGWWAVEDKRTGRLVGNVGAFFREDAPVMELGWNTYGEFRGQGFANEAAAAALHHAFEVRHENKVRALIAAANASSIRVAQRLGLHYEAQAEVHGEPVGLYMCERRP